MSKKKPSQLSTLVRACKQLFRVNRFEQTLLSLLKEKRERVYIKWNRGLGDIALGLYGVVKRVRHYDPDVIIVFVTRPDLEEAFSLLPDCETLIVREMERGKPFDIQAYLPGAFCFPDIDPTKDLPYLPGRLVPHLSITEELRNRVSKFNLKESRYVGLHVNSETGHLYGYEKNWPHKYWQELITELERAGRSVLLFGMHKGKPFEGGIDLRGKTSLYDVIALLTTVCDTLVAPDSGILSTIYYVNYPHPLHIFSLWTDPNQGVLRQNVPSPNEYLRHTPLIDESGISRIPVKTVLDSILQDTLLRVHNSLL